MGQHTLAKDLVEMFYFGGEIIVLEEGGSHIVIMGCRIVFGMIVR